mgnify:CR=1 FL=1
MFQSRLFTAVSLLCAVIVLASACSCVQPPVTPAAQESQASSLKTPSVISDNMVLQRGMKVPIWGWAAPGESVTVTFKGQSASAVADGQGHWMVRLGPFEASEKPADLIIAGKTKKTIANVLVGEVWVCSGQSNMEWSLNKACNGEAEVADARNYPALRLFDAPNTTATVPQSDLKAAWAVCSPESAAPFSAVGYFFGRELHQALKVPIGLIHSSWGGTPAEAWTRREALEAEPALKNIVARYDQACREYDPIVAERSYRLALEQWPARAEEARKTGAKPPRKPMPPTHPSNRQGSPGALYNGMIAPLIPYGIRGAIWYQGEANAARADEYRTLFPAMIQNWRADWGQGDFPFLFVQLANFMEVQTEPVQDKAAWPYLREAQLMTLSLPNTAMACAIDLADADNPSDIHPKNKQEVGRRLALAARARVYGEPVVYSGPIYKSMSVRDGQIRLEFNHVGSGLMAKGGEPLKGFAIAGADRKFVWADAKIDGDAVVVSARDVAAPAAVRYSWANNPIGNLYNKEGLPASPFRTDDWPAAAPAQ